MTTLPKPSNPACGLAASYDAWNHLVEVKEGEMLIATFTYDGLGRRIVETTSGTTRHFYFSATNQVLEERATSQTPAPSPESLAPACQYVWGLRYVDELILRDRDSDANGTLDERLYALQDANFNVTALVKQVSGTWQVVERFLYASYGDSTVLNADFTDKTGGTAYLWDYRFTGKQLDLVTGLYCYIGRYYHPTLGNMVQRDPELFRAGDANLYRYVHNSPGNFTDPSGMDQWQSGGFWDWCLGSKVIRRPFDGRSTISTTELIAAAKNWPGGQILTHNADDWGTPAREDLDGAVFVPADRIDTMFSGIGTALGGQRGGLGVVELGGGGNPGVGHTTGWWDFNHKVYKGDESVISGDTVNAVVADAFNTLRWQGQGSIKGLIILTGCNVGNVIKNNSPDNYLQRLATKTGCIVVASGGYVSGEVLTRNATVTALRQIPNATPDMTIRETDDVFASKDDTWYVFYP